MVPAKSPDFEKWMATHPWLLVVACSGSTCLLILLFGSGLSSSAEGAGVMALFALGASLVCRLTVKARRRLDRHEPPTS
jgi:hypothetical protein